MSHAIDLYFFTMSPPSRATMMLMKALNLKIELKIVNVPAGEQFKPEFLKLNPLHTIPVISDNGFVLYDSNAIMKYLVDEYAKDDSLYPKDPKKGAIVTQRVFFVATVLFRRFGEFYAPVMFKGESPDKEAKKRLEESLENLNGFLDGNMWIAGPDLTVPDFSTITIISTIDATGAIDLTSYNNLWKWYQRCKEAMAGYGYSDNQAGAQQFGNYFKSKLHNK